MKNSNRSLMLLCLVCLLSAQMSLHAQTPMPSKAAPKPRIDLPVPPNIAAQYAGIESGKQVRWSLRDAILSALENNLDIEIERDNVRLAQFDLFATRGAYDPTFTSSLNYNLQRQPNTFPFSGSTQNVLTTDTFNYNAGLSRAIERTGGRVDLTFNNARTVSNTSNLETSYSPSVNVTYTHPLLRNAKTDANRRQIRIAKKRLDVSDAQFRQQAIEIISRVQKAYWDLAFAQRDEELKRENARLAEEQFRNNQKQAEVGTLAPIDVVSAATQLETRRQEIFQAMNAVAQAQNALKQLVIRDAKSEVMSAQIMPIETFEAKPFTLTLEDALRLAKDNRPELRQADLQREINQVEIEFQRNQSKPQVDAFVSYGSTGVAGTAAQFPDQNGNLQPARVAPEFIGGYGTALGNLASNDFRTVRVGVNISLPFGNRTAKANLGRALAADHQLDLQRQRQQLAIDIEVRNAMQAAEMARQRITTARTAREYAEQQLAGEEKKFSAGLSTTFLVLTRQTELAQSRVTELRSLTDYNKAVADLQKAIATTLETNEIQLKQP